MHSDNLAINLTFEKVAGLVLINNVIEGNLVLGSSNHKKQVRMVFTSQYAGKSKRLTTSLCVIQDPNTSEEAMNHRKPNSVDRSL